MKSIIRVVLFAIGALILLLSGCQGGQLDLSQVSEKDVDKLVRCDPPYIRFASGCCLDQNNNSICDADEGENKPLIKSQSPQKNENINCEKLAYLEFSTWWDHPRILNVRITNNDDITTPARMTISQSGKEYSSKKIFINSFDGYEYSEFFPYDLYPDLNVNEKILITFEAIDETDNVICPEVTNIDLEAMDENMVQLVDIFIDEWSINTELATIEPGNIRFVIQNQGQFPHALKIADQQVAINPGEFDSIDISLTPGVYEIYDPLPGNKEKGMHTSITVT
ncbi:MAG: hypothetical protein AABX72_03375 [Nanoarchaeota archaeon]